MPAGTPATSPLTADISFPPRRVTRVDWRMPPGSMGQVGWYLASSRVQQLPIIAGQYVIADNQTGFWEVDDLPDSGDWQVIAYNTGTVQHSIYLVFHLAVIERQPTFTDAISQIALAEAPDLSHAGPPVRSRR